MRQRIKSFRANDLESCAKYPDDGFMREVGAKRCERGIWLSIVHSERPVANVYLKKYGNCCLRSYKKSRLVLGENLTGVPTYAY